MGAMRRATISAAAAVVMCLATACGGSNSGTQPGTPSRTATSGAPATNPGAARALSGSAAAGSTPISSPAYRKLIATAAGDKGLSPPIAAKVADCIVKRETAQGYRTVADVARSETSRQRAIEDARECTTQAFPSAS
jgi:hypothetical protein